MRIVVATRNRKKIEEIRRIAGGADIELIELLGLDAFPGCPEVVETESTFEGNAIKKAREVAAHTGLTALADDSGLVVDALGGAPGVLSARYAGEGATDRDNVEKLLMELGATPAAKRTARFVCVIALAEPDGSVRTFEGRVEGAIGTEPRGSWGFGYDPVFYPERPERPEGHGRTFAEMPPEEKDSMSHRGRALALLGRALARK